MTTAIYTRLFFILTLLLSPLKAQSSIHLSETQEPAKLSFEIETQTAYDEKLISLLEKHSVFEKLRVFSERDLHLKQKVVYRIGNANEDTETDIDNIATEIGSSLNISIPFSFLYKLDQELRQKYPEQPEVIEAIYSAAVEKYLWFEFGRVLMAQFELGFSGQEVFALDNFSTLMLINLNHQQSDYILDATEAFLLLEQSIPFITQEDYDAEVSLDDERYRKAVCLILGKDYLTHLSHTRQSYHQLLEKLAWDQERIELCKKLYLEKLEAWLRALQPHLKDENRLNNWLASH